MEGNGRTDKIQTLEPNSGIEVMKGFKSDEASLCLKRGSVHSVSGSVISEPGGFPFSVANDSFLTSTADEYRSTGTNFEGIRVARFSEIIELDNTARNESSLDDDWEEIVSMLRKEQELKLSTIAGHEQMSDPTVQICLPDEDSLITIDDLLVPQKPPNLQREKMAESAFEYSLPDEESLIAFDDLIIPRHSPSASRGNSSKDDLPPSKVPADILEKLRAQNFLRCDARSTLPGYYGAMSLGTSYHNQQFEQSYTELFHSQINPGVHALYSHQTQINSHTKFMGPKTSPPLKHFNALPCRRSKAKPKRPDPSVRCSMPRQPVVIPPYQQNELLRDPVLANYMTQLTSHAQGLNPTPILPSNCQQTSYDGFRLPTLGKAVCARTRISYFYLLSSA
ncbi:hypothetical protein Acr_14g0007430 [Actinidia rufa]|uniref:Uncharacterized protein n=1 Tax=Actinidia rufa TaxID=165716 RepID=A0A7J0FT46_9ERIC|nr:hypothetical protein Acr_14g0007430 [Actinidia rufa]